MKPYPNMFHIAEGIADTCRDAIIVIINCRRYFASHYISMNMFDIKCQKRRMDRKGQKLVQKSILAMIKDLIAPLFLQPSLSFSVSMSPHSHIDPRKINIAQTNRKLIHCLNNIVTLFNVQTSLSLTLDDVLDGKCHPRNRKNQTFASFTNLI